MENGGYEVGPSDLWQGLRSTAERSPDIESSDEFSRSAGVTSAGYLHNSDRQGFKLSNIQYSIASGFIIPWDPPHFPLQDRAVTHRG